MTNGLTTFWERFETFSDKLYETESPSEEFFNNIVSSLKQVNPDLFFELGPKAKQREFIVSANGMREAFPIVMELVKSAPKFKKWEIIPFRQRKGKQLAIDVAGIELNTKDMRFSHTKVKDKLDIIVYVKNGRENAEYFMAMFVLLDSLLGEYDVETKIGNISVKNLLEKHPKKIYPLDDLPDLIDNLFLKRVD